MTELVLDRYGAPLTRDLLIAVAALLMGAANADNRLQAEEHDAVAGILVEHFAVSRTVAHDVATASAEFMGTVDRLILSTRLVRDNFGPAQHQLILTLLVKVCAVDLNYEAEERNFILGIAAQLGFSAAQVRALPKS